MTPTAPLTTAADAQEAARWILCMVEPQEKWSVLQDRIAEYLTTYAAQVRPQWMPIESAPKDGTRILIASLGGIGIGRWGKSAADHEPGWADGGAYFIGATNWQPLPSPPGSPSSQTDTGDSNG